MRPALPVVSQPVIAVVRHGAGPAETALLELLRQETWHTSTSPVSCERRRGALRHRARRRPGGRDHLGTRVQESTYDAFTARLSI
ncbi:hypothetical protein [Actinoallomurus oryzae]|uniref:hypothetical protein n=1 Tax=Actinoallomurus oryzae TaxID=502180 RepID=UPI0031F0E207